SAEEASGAIPYAHSGGAPVHGQFGAGVAGVRNRAARTGRAHGDGEEFSAPERSLPGRGGSFLSDWIAVLGRLCARDLARPPALRGRSQRRSAGVPGGG